MPAAYDVDFVHDVPAAYDVDFVHDVPSAYLLPVGVGETPTPTPTRMNALRREISLYKMIIFDTDK